MKVKSITIHNFKRFEDFHLSLENEVLVEVSDRFLILGDNGTGKTTILQAIALPLALATRRISDISDFHWSGFLAGRYWRNGAPKIELTVTFTEQERLATRAIAQRWYDKQPAEFKHNRFFTEPGNSPEVTLLLDGDYWQAGNTPEERAQFQGRYYAQALLKRGDYEARSAFRDLPGVFWFDQFRNLGSQTSSEPATESGQSSGTQPTFEAGVSQLRQYLVNWYQRQQSNPNAQNGDDYLSQLEVLYQRIFPGRRFFGIERVPRLDSPTEDTTYFLLEDEQNRHYDVAEMSAGEQSIFPILYEFIRQQISNSIVLIDEVDLNLHPPAAQHLMKQLSRLEPSCQFIVTTHSEAASAIASPYEVHRLPGGALCL